MARSAETATRVVEIQRLLVSGNLSPSDRFRLSDEQRELWDDEFKDMPFEQIAARAMRVSAPLFMFSKAA